MHSAEIHIRKFNFYDMARIDDLLQKRKELDERFFKINKGLEKASEKEIKSLFEQFLNTGKEIRDISRKESRELRSQRQAVSSQIRKEQPENDRFDSKYFNWDNMKDQRDIDRFSLGKFMREAVEGQLTGVEAEMNTEGKEEIRKVWPSEGPRGFCIPARVLENLQARSNTGQNAGTAGDGGNLIPQSAMLYFDALRNALVLPSMGATFLTGLVGSVPIVKGGLFASHWLAEGEAVTVSKEEIGKILMQAKRLSSYAAFSKQLLKQTSPGIDQMIQNSLIYANAEAIQSAVINGLTANNQPLGLLNNSDVSQVVGGTNGLAPTWNHMLELEGSVASNNADIGNMGYLTNAKVRSKLKGTLKASNVAGYIWDGTEVNGYKAAVTNSVPSTLTKGTAVEVCSAIIFGDWSKLIIGTWGGLDIVVDQFSRAEYSEIRFIINSFVDAQIVNAKSFAVMKDALTA